MRGSAGNLSLLSLASLRERSQWAGPTPMPEKPWPSRALLGEVAGSRRATCSLVTSLGGPAPPLGEGGTGGGPSGGSPGGPPAGAAPLALPSPFFCSPALPSPFFLNSPPLSLASPFFFSPASPFLAPGGPFW